MPKTVNKYQGMRERWLALPVSRRRRLVIAVSAIAILAMVGMRWITRSYSPDEVAQKAATALCDHDVDTLLALTMSEEREKLHLTRTNVEAFLNETLYTHLVPKSLSARLTESWPIDQRGYELKPVGVADGDYRPIFVAVTQSRDDSWHLPLAYVLRAISARYRSEGTKETSGEVWAALGKKYGIRGSRLNTYGYGMIPGM